nr:2'-5' RNA ligase family protein [uncultured Chryseobacterium sp.]
MKKLYFIAIYPPQEIIEEVKVFKKDLAIHYGNSKALKNEAHITLFPPFSREIELENDIFDAFQRIETKLTPFEIELNGFGSFSQPKNPVIFIHPENNPDLTDLHQRVKKQFNFKSYTFTPHMTIGYRDLTWENFVKAWEKYQSSDYKTKFLVDKILLLRHDGSWISIAEKKLEKN